jgi:ribosome biogenesis protein Nip4
MKTWIIENVQEITGQTVDGDNLNHHLKDLRGHSLKMVTFLADSIASSVKDLKLWSLSIILRAKRSKKVCRRHETGIWQNQYHRLHPPRRNAD